MTIIIDPKTSVLSLTDAEKEWLRQQLLDASNAVITLRQCGNIHQLFEAIERGEFSDLVDLIMNRRSQMALIP